MMVGAWFLRDSSGISDVGRVWVHYAFLDARSFLSFELIPIRKRKNICPVSCFIFLGNFLMWKISRSI